MLHVSPDLLPALYDGHPKVLIVKSRAQPWTFVPPTNTVRWLIAEKSDTGGFILTGAADTGTDHHLLDMPPTNVWVVWNPHDEEQAAGLAQWWAGAGGIGAEPSFIDGDAAKLNAALFERARAEIARLTQANQLLIEDLAALRESWAQDVRLPPELEDLLANLRLAPPRLIFETAAPTVDAKTVQAAMGGGKAPHLCQRLPIGAHGLLGIDVHVAVPGSGNGHLRVSLFVRETENALAHWEIAYDELKPGWLPLRLPAALTLRSHGLELRVHATGGVNAPKFTCSPVGLLPEYSCTSTGSETAGDTMLAFKLWGGIPGTKANTGLSMAPLPADPVMAIPEHTVAAARTTRELTWAYPYFGYLKGGRVLLRPLRENPASAASISLPAIPGISAVSCQATIDDGLCKTRLLVRLAVTRPGHNADEAEQGIGVLASTAWIELAEPLKPFPLTIRLPEPLSSPIDIHFFSRLPRGGTLEHGRVIFDGFEAALSDRAAWQCAPVMPLATP